MTREDVSDLFIKKNDLELKLKTKKSEKRIYELDRKCIEENIDSKITASYEEYIKTNKTSDATSNIAIKKIENSKELEYKIEEIEKEIARLEYLLNIVIEKLKILSYKEKVLLESKFVHKMQDYEIGNITYWKYFKQTRDERTIQRIIERALKKMESVA